MPKEKKKRGRRAEEARRKQQEEKEAKHVDIDMPMEFYDVPSQGSNTDNAAMVRSLLITSDCRVH